MSKPIILIPSYNPDGTLPETIGLLREKGFERFVIVNDGSRAECAPCLLYTSPSGAWGRSASLLYRFRAGARRESI